jgi:phosphoribosyl-ATP pyrophosphohydrolase
MPTATATRCRFTVRQQPPGFCHLNTRTCWGPDRGLGALARRLAERKVAAPAGSYTAKLFADPDLLGAKLREEADELAVAETRDNVIHEAADVLYFTLATLARHGVDLAEVEEALDRRALKVTRRD